MPGMSGLECLRAVRANHNEIPFIFLTGQGSRENLGDALRLGAMDFLYKPCAVDDLLRAVRQALRLGMFIRGLESEITHLIQKYEISAADQDRLRTFQRAALTGRVPGRKAA